MFKFFGSKTEVPTGLPSKEVYLDKVQIEKNRRSNNFDYLVEALKKDHLEKLRLCLLSGESYYHFTVDAVFDGMRHHVGFHVDLPEGITEQDIELTLAEYLQDHLKDAGYDTNLVKCKCGYKFNF